MRAMRPLIPAALLLVGCATVRPPIVGQTFDPALPALDDTPFSWDDTRGKVVVVDLWASWCHACAAEIPALATIQHEWRDRGVAYVGIDVDADPRAGTAFLKAIGATGLTTLSDRSAQYVEKHVDIRQLPTRLFLDRAGAVRLLQDGFVAGDDSKIRAAIASLLDEPVPVK